MNTKKRNLRLFYAIAFLQGMVFYAPVATLYRQARGLSVFDVAAIESVSIVLMLVLEIPWGYLADRIGYKKTILVCNIIYFASKIVFWQASGFPMFLLERVLLAVVCAGLSGCDSAYLYLSAREGDGKRVFGLYEAAGTAGILLASVAFSALVKDDYGLSALLTAAAYGLAMALSFFLPEVRASADAHTPFAARCRAVWSALRGNGRFALFLVAVTLLTQSGQTITVFLNQLQYLRSGIPAAVMGYLYVLTTAASFASVLSGRLSARLGEACPMAGMFAAAFLCCAAMALFANPVVSVLGIVLLRASASLASPFSMDTQNRQIALSDRATMLSVYAMAMDGVAVGTNLVFGKLADIGVAWAMAAGAAFCAAGLALYALWRRLNAAGPAKLGALQE